jgi:hypothetical protein
MLVAERVKQPVGVSIFVKKGSISTFFPDLVLSNFVVPKLHRCHISFHSPTTGWIMPTNEQLAILRQIAEYRAEGRSWAEIAQELKQSVQAVRTLVWENESLYLPLLRKARSEFMKACCLDAMRTLQQQLKSNDEKLRNSAANCLLRFWMARMRYQSACQKLLKKEKSTPTKRAATTPNVPNSPATISSQTTSTINAQTPTPDAKKPFSGPTISSDEVLKWLNEKKVAV